MGVDSYAIVKWAFELRAKLFELIGDGTLEKMVRSSFLLYHGGHCLKLGDMGVRGQEDEGRGEGKK